jgi:hypothetical protein
MSDWIVVACLLTLRGEFNAVSPSRDKGADGTIGDSNHTSSSDHTPDEDSSVLRGKDADSIDEVHALDVDSSGPWPGGWAWFDRTIKAIVAEERRRWLDPNDTCRLEYVIWNHTIYSRSHDFAPRSYGGSDPHTNHAHFSARYLTRSENDTRPWGVLASIKPAEEDGFMADISQADFNKLMNGWIGTADARRDTADAILKGNVPSAKVPARTVLNVLSDVGNQLRPALVFPPDHPENVTSGMPADAPVLKLLETPAKVDAVASQVAAIAAQVAILAGRASVDVDEAALAQAIVSGLSDDVARSFVDALATRFNLKLVPISTQDNSATSR